MYIAAPGCRGGWRLRVRNHRRAGCCFSGRGRIGRTRASGRGRRSRRAKRVAAVATRRGVGGHT